MSIEDPEKFENRPLYRRVGLYLVGIFIVGLTASALVFSVAMQGMGWSGIVLGVPAQGAVPLDQSAISLYVSPHSRQFFNGNGGNYDTLLTPWRKYFSDKKIRAKEIGTPDDLAKLKPSTLVLPSAVALSDDERREILGFRDRGGSVLLTWATGTRDGTGAWVGGEFIAKLSNARFSGELNGESQAGYLVLNGESVASLRDGAGRRIWLGNNAERPLRFKSSDVAARFLTPFRATTPDRMDEGAIVFHEANPSVGRVAAFGFAESSWEHQPADIYAVVDDVLTWLRRQPMLLKAAWPDGKQAAQLVEVDTEQEPGDVLRMSALLKSMNLRGAFYLLGSGAMASPQVAQTLKIDHEIGFHGDIAVSFKNQPADMQNLRILSMQVQFKTALTDIGGVTSFRAPAEGYDKTTEVAVQKAGIRQHLSGPHDTELCLPKFAPIEGTDIDDGLLRLPRSQRDDMSLLKEINEPEALTQALINDFEIMRQSGCLGILSVHSNNLAEGGLIQTVLPAYLTHTKKRGDTVWLTSPQMVDRWWRDRERLRVAVRSSGARFEFDVSVGGKNPVQGGTFVVLLPKKGILPTVTGVKPGMPQPKVMAIDDYRASIVFGNLPPGNYFYQANF